MGVQVMQERVAMQGLSLCIQHHGEPGQDSEQKSNVS